MTAIRSAIMTITTIARAIGSEPGSQQPMRPQRRAVRTVIGRQLVLRLRDCGDESLRRGQLRVTVDDHSAPALQTFQKVQDGLSSLNYLGSASVDEMRATVLAAAPR